MKKRNLIKSVCLGIILMTFSGCWSDDKKNQEIDDNNFFGSVNKMFGVNEKNYINLEGNWRFSIGDDTAWASPDFSDNNWEKIKVPSAWENQGFHGYNGYAWYRKTFEIPKELIGSNFILNAGFIDDADQTYINGKVVGMSGSFPPWFMTAYDAHREYYIPKEILKEGKNTIAIRVYDAELEGGIKGEAIGLSPARSDVHSITDLDLEINLSGMWKFKTGDSIKWKDTDFDDVSWREIFVPAYWEVQGFRNYDGFAWYRKSFTVPEKFADQKMVLILGKIDDIDQTFVNGQLVGAVGDWNFNKVPLNFNQNEEWLTIRGYYIPDNILQFGGENIISVRVYDGFIDGGIYQGPIGLITQDKYIKFWNRRNELNQ
jgi:beta-galactosidase/beta-glucuronidase